MKIAVNTKEFKEAVKRITPYCDYRRPVLNCIHLSRTSAGLRLIGANGFILGLTDVPGVWDTEEFVEAIIPAKVLGEYLKPMKPGKNDTLTLDFVMGPPTYTSSDVPTYADMVNGLQSEQGRFPDYTHIIPSYDRVVTVFSCDGLELKKACQTVGVMRKEFEGIKITCNGVLRLYASCESFGSVCTTLDCDTVGPAMTLGLNIRYLELCAQEKGPVMFRLSAPDQALTARSKTMLSVIMPMDMTRHKCWQEGDNG